MKLSKDKLIDINGFLFNSSTHFWQADKQYSVSASASKSYLKSVIEGHFPHSMMWIEAIGLSLNVIVLLFGTLPNVLTLKLPSI